MNSLTSIATSRKKETLLLSSVLVFLITKHMYTYLPFIYTYTKLPGSYLNAKGRGRERERERNSTAKEKKRDRVVGSAQAELSLGNKIINAACGPESMHNIA